MAPQNDNPDSSSFKEVFAAECGEIRARRAVHGATETGRPGAPPEQLTGLALSGGGIRSATFCLGVLQRLAQLDVLKRFDYLSTVSGGGFIGGWWSAWLSRQGTAPSPASPIFPPKEQLETDRGDWSRGSRTSRTPDQPRTSASSINAWEDPTHHLRLFANYLTPRKGALSADTWRAITVVSRNLLLTILMLVPLLAAAILASQFYFTTNHAQIYPYVCGRDATERVMLTPSVAGTVTRVCAVPDTAAVADPGKLVERGAWLAIPLVVLAGGLAFSLAVWMVFSIGRFWLAAIAFGGITAIVLVVSGALQLSSHSALFLALAAYRPGLLFALGAAPVLLYSVWLVISRRRATAEQPVSASEVLTNLMTRLQGTLLVALTVIGVTLLFGGFAHELVRYAGHEVGPDGDIGRRVARAGGWIAVIWAAAGALFTGLKAAPTGGADSHQRPPSLISQTIFAVTPPMVLLVLLVLVASGTHSLLGALVVVPVGEFSPLIAAFFLAILLCEFFGTYDYCTDADAKGGKNWLIVAGSAACALAVMAVTWFVVNPLEYDRRNTGLYLGVVSGIIAVPWLARATRRLHPDPAGWQLSRSRGRTLLLMTSAAIAGATVGFVGGAIPLADQLLGGTGSRLVAALALGGISYGGMFVLLSGFTGSWINLRLLTLHSVAALLLALVLLPQFLNPTLLEVIVPTDIVALVGIVVGGIVGFGWMLDPNYLSLHTFYRARLVRAYLGASNESRHLSGADISESVPGDDVPLIKLDGAEKGGPYHLINATLSLVGGRDLATAQRSSTYFTMSRRFCGSLHTGYRPTSDYMAGQLSLGTAVSVSGAAASPNMGAKTPSAALAMLMALLNVRLGFWAPTPNQARWKSRGPRLWPFYLLREFLSQTNDLGPYCYLTDGGHFDNTGLYSLVQRGCRQILFVDCGADPEPCFADVGDAIRRCRIDFGVDIDLKVGNFVAGETAAAARQHFVVGTITYSRRHAEALGWTDLKDLTGSIIWLKPSLLNGDPAEVRQYAIENGAFPQQSTADQWFDEAQFESYRRLGEACAEELVTARKGSLFGQEAE